MAEQSVQKVERTWNRKRRVDPQSCVRRESYRARRAYERMTSRLPLARSIGNEFLWLIDVPPDRQVEGEMFGAPAMAAEHCADSGLRVTRLWDDARSVLTLVVMV